MARPATANTAPFPSKANTVMRWWVNTRGGMSCRVCALDPLELNVLECVWL